MAESSSPPSCWLSPQQSFLALLTLAIAAAFIHSTQSSSMHTTDSDYDFPEVVPLPGWLPAPQESEFETGVTSVDRGAVLPTGIEVASARYVYLSDSSGWDESDRVPMELTIEMRYFSDSNGDAKSFIHEISGDVQSVLQYRDGVGSYGVYADGDRAYVTACINSAGGSTVLSDDFRGNRYRYDFRLARIWNWALGRSGIQDRRCLWTHLEIDYDSSATSELATDLVEFAWLDWFEWWNSNYPNS
ncbi:MAG: cyanoexosortase A system-associated protein [Cyanobacteria bacterium P01_E01_bin.45]